MVPEYGHLALILPLLLAALLTVIPLAGTFTGRVLWMNSARSLATSNESVALGSALSPQTSSVTVKAPTDAPSPCNSSTTFAFGLMARTLSLEIQSSPV